MNTENIQTVVDWLEAGAPHSVFSMHHGLLATSIVWDLDFDGIPPDQLDKVDDCGTVCCMAGAAAQFGGLKPADDRSWSVLQNAALSYFGLPPTSCHMLPVFNPHGAPPFCSPQRAAVALKLWAEQAETNPNFNPWMECAQ
jgi:hypothetical protein